MSKRKTYQSDFKVRVVLESFQRDTTIEQVRKRYDIHTSVINRWRSIFKKNAHLAFEKKKKTKKVKPSQSPEELKRIIGELTVQNELLKKALNNWG
jgi:transposase-like protein